MKIKYLKIRNIASIEKADIDFEQGLHVAGEASPSPLFLITGDTGSGKSVILDCISMDLYGTTPRVKGVANRTNNSFIGSDGNEIKIHDISQYTRLGISSKDDCYSELTFEGNDGVIYISKFSLGVARTGNFRPVGWRLQVGDSEIIEGNKKDEIRKRIVTAVGLTYEQFCRMAMLAQGQFADFLTGGKEERERILEQLTSTQHFSRYGEAIERIFKRAKQKKEYSERLLASETGHLMSEEEEKATNDKLTQLEHDIKDIKKRKDKIENVLSIMTGIASKEQECKGLKSEIIRFNEIKAGEEFQTKLDLLQRWDGTSTERENLRKKGETVNSLNASCRRYALLLSHFSILSEDSARRKTLIDTKRESLEKIKEALKIFEPHRRIYENIPVIREKFNHLEQLSEEISTKRKDLRKELEETESLKELFSQADQESKSASAKLKEKKELLDRLNNSRQALNPEANAKALEDKLIYKNNLENLSAVSGLAEEYHLALVKGNEEKAKLTEKAENLKVLSIKAEKETENLQKKLEEARQIYATMHLSVEENFNKLRIKLADENAHACPLCGQPKEWHDSRAELNQAFTNILSPLEQENDRLKRECDAAESSHLDIMKRFNQTAGMIQTQEQTIKNLKDSLEKRRKELRKIMPLVGIGEDFLTELSDDNSSIYDRLRKKVSDLSVNVKKELAFLTEVKQKADNLQTEINEELIKCRPLEEEDSKATKKRNDAHTNLLLNAQKINNLEKSIEYLTPRISICEAEIDQLVLSHSPEWRKNTSSTLQLIQEEGERYKSAIEKEKSITEKINNTSKVLDSIKDISKDIEAAVAHFKVISEDRVISESFIKKTEYDSSSEEEYPKHEPDGFTTNAERATLETLPKLWHGLFGEISSEIRTIEKYMEDIHTIDQRMDEYYRESGSDEKQLESLMDMELSIPALREYVSELNTKIVSRNDALKIASDALFELNESLNKNMDSENQEIWADRAVLEENKIALGKKLEECLKETGIARERMQQNEANKKRVAEVSANLEKDREHFTKWDLLNRHFGGTRFRTLVQSYILRPLLRNANVYLSRITDHFTLTCSEQNEQLSILVLDRYNKNKIRSATVLSGGERFMISLALSLALSAMNKPGLNIDILFIDEGFGTLDAGSLNAVIETLRRLPEITGRNGRRVGVISHREELADCIDVQIKVNKCGEGRSRVEIKN
ncbi:MAG: SMC family ATPase [Muribaculaceae bacterium]|nr:SMC family ATPase [Muribaculaceae bacterium]